MIVEKGVEIDRPELADLVESFAAAADKGEVTRVARPFGPQVRGADRRVPGLLRPLDGDRQDRADR